MVSSVAANGESGARDAAAAYIDYLYTHQAQDIAASHFYRPGDPLTKAKYAARFQTTGLFTIDEVFGGWRKAEQKHFAKGDSSIRFGAIESDAGGRKNSLYCCDERC
jgi:sulfate/thiosulfate transport system substrate-binding protein